MKYKLSVKKLKIGKSNLTKAKMKSRLCKKIKNNFKQLNNRL